MHSDMILHNPTREQVDNLLNFDVNPSPIYATGPDGEPFEIPGKTAWVTSDTNQVLGIHGEGWVPYPYKRLSTDIDEVVNGSVQRLGAGLLYDRGVAFIQIAMPENMKSSEGIEFKPFLMGTTSFNGMFRTCWGNGTIIIVCRNTHLANVNSAQISVKHTKSSEAKLRIESVQEALGILHENAEIEAERIDALCRVPVNDAQFEAFLNQLLPLNTEEARTGRAETIRSGKRDSIWTLFQNDKRCEPRHTAWGALQATNTFNHWEATIRGTEDRELRNMENVVSGKFLESDQRTIKLLSKVLDRELVVA